MEVVLAHVGSRGSSRDSVELLVQMYMERCSAFAKVRMEAFRSEEAVLSQFGRKRGRLPAVIVLLDSRGRTMNSEAFATWIGVRRDGGAQQIVFAIGPADGWSESALKQAGLVLSLGPMTLAHSLARLVVAEQIYRAFTILAGHPYHTGH